MTAFPFDIGFPDSLSRIPGESLRPEVEQERSTTRFYASLSKAISSSFRKLDQITLDKITQKLDSSHAFRGLYENTMDQVVQLNRNPTGQNPVINLFKWQATRATGESQAPDV